MSKLNNTKLPSKANFFISYTMIIFLIKTIAEQLSFNTKLSVNILIYLTCIVLSLAYIFENLRKISLQNYNLDPSLSWDIMLREAGVTNRY